MRLLTLAAGSDLNPGQEDRMNARGSFPRTWMATQCDDQAYAANRRVPIIKSYYSRHA
ncbi:hypothetical protein ACSS6W_001980 [Trichoderma asperelloides]